MKPVAVLGVAVHPVDLPSTLESMAAAIERRDPGYIVLAPAHNVLAARDDPALAQAFAASTLTVPDGMGVVWLLRALGHRQAGRVYGPDLMLAACAAGLDAGWRHFFLGGSPEVAAVLVERLSARYPGLRIAGSYAPPFRPPTFEEERTMMAMIQSAEPDIVWVALGSPRQELWMAEHRPALEAPVLVGVGAAFDFIAGAKRQAPRWMQRLGLEWLFRLLSEPRRLWRRYFQYPRFALLALAQILGLLRDRMEEKS